MPSMIDLTNKNFGKLTVVKRDLSKISGAAYWICKCECGNIKSIRGDGLRNGTVLNCGCEKKKRIDLDPSFIGQKFGRLTVIERDLSKPSGRGYPSYWLCQCECGNVKSISKQSLNSGKVKSCGCLRSEMITKKNTLDLTGQRFGKLVALQNTYRLSKHNSYIWKCQCDCGNIHYCSAEILNSGKIHSCGCQKHSFGEEKINQILTENNILFNSEYSFSNLKNPKTNYYYRYDFAILNQNNQVIRLIEFDGEQHFKPSSKFGGEEGFKARVESDKIKNQYAKEHNIPLVRIPYTEINHLSLNLLLGDKFLV
jgi:hypothetical protein